MVRLATFGGEWGNEIGDGAGDATVESANETTTIRSGTYGFAYTNAESGRALGLAAPGTLDRWYYLRGYFRISGNPTTRTFLLSISSSGSDDAHVELQTDGTVRLVYGTYAAPPTQVGSASSALTAGVWYRIELGYRSNTAANDNLELRIDGVSIASGTVAVSTAAPTDFAWGPHGAAPGVGVTIYTDDLALNDDTGTFQNSWPGEGKVVLLRPTADSQVGSWTGGAGATSNLYAALDNVPPVGVAAADDTDLTQIKSADGSGDNSTDEYRATMQTYTAGGIAGGDTVTLAQAVLWHGEEVGTGSKTGSVAILSNPTQTGVSAFTFSSEFGGSEMGAVGVWGTNWAIKYGDAQDASGVTKGTAPVVALRKTDSGTRVASVCALGLYVEYVPSLALPFRPVSHHLLRR